MTANTILLTGFEPFAGDPVNPSWEVARALDGVVCAGLTVRARLLPVVFQEARPRLLEALAELRPSLALGLGLANGIPHLALERVALNLMDARIPDNAGAQPVDLPVVAGAPAAFFTDLPVKAMRAALLAAGIPAALSLSAGSFVCNQVFYTLRQAIASDALACRGGFLHLPLLPAQAALTGQPSMTLELMVAGVRLALEVAVATRVDLDLPGGSLN